MEEVPAGADSVDTVVGEALSNLANGPTVFVGEQMRAGAGMLTSMGRNDAVRLLAQMSAQAMAGD